MAGYEVLATVLLTILFRRSVAQLSPSFYNSSCPTVETVVTNTLQQAMQSDVRIAASLLRVHFHDCFVNGCDASVLLDDTANFTGEKTAAPNNASLRGFDVIDQMKSQVDSVCNNTVSCADILAIAAKAAVVLSGGPSWTVQLGRRDSTTANFSLAQANIPPPTSTNAQLIAAYQNVGLSTQDMVVLSGAHTFGRARCTTFSNRLFNFTNGQPDPRINTAYLATLQQICPNGGNGSVVANFDPVTQDTFDNQYYANVLNGQGLLNSDAELLNGTTAALVSNFSTDQTSFFNNFAVSMVNMGNLQPLTGSQGEIRSNCRKTN
ncbi:peroxidase A2 [Selaginella moellendorffii]|uniref:peroxidase A2 n=1 Tax=Selaginella moellendorffii TaxID=88036 RepID=UPI000D1C2A6C|nr:peroxidase A2 [Selaginella moellendorffii]XP_024529618.1 peroxidase A2 [Selaginella moellendorffii]|eukprot:XP_024529616.1 peroxidase A2 [Selaginella moellendorffii]